ncbi:DUF169 domain-containing protein [Clostridium sp. UBA4548]|uniref:DUF169 domain-containing protein n=1 Tax=Clostridium sp. UBA4548 TaxID=1946361 RepID=UPI0025BC4827|nr:DUF169 domain-containing protein [Clostridium sp. UBA4548]
MELTWKEALIKLNCSLELERQIVGIKFIFSEKEYKSLEVQCPIKKINYCGMVKSGACGNALKVTGDMLACASGGRTLGFIEDTVNESGQVWTRLGLYKNAEVSKQVRESLTYSKANPYGVLVQPLSNFDSEPDIALIVTNSYNLMRIVQGYSYHYGARSNFGFVGNQAICYECTAKTFLTQDMQISALCIGTRHRAGWKDHELAVGIPMKQFTAIADGVFNTVNNMESNEKKHIIEEKLMKAGITELTIEYDSNYYKKV